MCVRIRRRAKRIPKYTGRNPNSGVHQFKIYRRRHTCHFLTNIRDWKKCIQIATQTWPGWRNARKYRSFITGTVKSELVIKTNDRGVFTIGRGAGIGFLGLGRYDWVDFRRKRGAYEELSTSSWTLETLRWWKRAHSGKFNT